MQKLHLYLSVKISSFVYMSFFFMYFSPYLTVCFPLELSDYFCQFKINLFFFLIGSYFFYYAALFFFICMSEIFILNAAVDDNGKFI